MNWFKSKHKRSAWFEGLLQAEELHKEGGWTTDGVRAEFFMPTSSEVGNGAYEYCWYIDNLERVRNK